MAIPHNILVTGGAGFIGSNFIRYLFGKSTAEGDLFNDADFSGTVVNVDCLTYAGNLENLADVETEFGGKRYFFEKTDICDSKEITRIFEHYNIDTVIHFAAESHVDRSILGPEAFVKKREKLEVPMFSARAVWPTLMGSLKCSWIYCSAWGRRSRACSSMAVRSPPRCQARINQSSTWVIYARMAIS